MKQPRRLRHAATPSAAAFALSLAACEGTIETVQLTAVQLEQVEENIEFIEAEGLQLVEGLIQRGDHWFATEGRSIDSDRMIEEVRETVQLVRDFYDEGKIKGFHADNDIQIGAYGAEDVAGFSEEKFRPKKDFIAVQIEDDGHLDAETETYVHEAAHQRSLRDGLPRLIHGHSEAVLYATDHEWEGGLGAAVYKDKDFAFLTTNLFRIADDANRAIKKEIDLIFECAEDVVAVDVDNENISADFVIYTPQQAYEYVRDQKQQIATNVQQWIDLQFGIRKHEYLHVGHSYFEEYRTEMYGLMYQRHQHLKNLAFYGINVSEIMEAVTESGMWELREQKWEAAIKQFVDSFPDESIETVEEREEKEQQKEPTGKTTAERVPQEIRPQPRTRLR